VDYAKARSWRRRGEQAAAPLVHDVDAPEDQQAAPEAADERSVAS
jgi:hypothetical protein